jgi:hypothetical protein
MNTDIFNYFLLISKDIQHSDSTYKDHCVGIYNILKEMKLPENICLAGLFHSVYSTEYFKISNPPTREEIQKVIGNEAEQLVYVFCNLRNRHNVILNNSFNFDKQFHIALASIEYANLKEQQSRINDQAIVIMCESLLKIIYSVEPDNCYQLNDKNIWVFDNLMDRTDAEYINDYCVNSLFKPDHSSNNGLHYDIDSRFVASMTENDLVNTRLLPKIKAIAKFLNEDIFIGKYYINHYSLMTGVSQHTDSSFADHYTILIFCNKYWEESWGGEIVFYNDKSQAHSAFDFKPQRIIIFDSRIAHKVLPLTRNAKKDRYTIAIKCSTLAGLEDLKRQYPEIVAVKK